MKLPNSYTCVIPVRYNSTRFPGKPFISIDGKSMLERVVDNAQNAKLVSKVLVAANGEEIVDFCKRKNIPYVAVNESCRNGAEAVCDAVEKTETSDYIFELQGDQPLVSSEVIDTFLSKANQLIEKNSAIDIVQPYARLANSSVNDVDIVKVVVSNSGRFLSFTRLPIQSGFRTLGLYLWRKESLLSFPSLPVSDLEQSESCHLVRFVLNDLYVQGVQLDDSNWIEVDRPEHVELVEEVLRQHGSN